jgi:flagellar FliL protein
MATKDKAEDKEEGAAKTPPPKKTPILLIVAGAVLLLAVGGGGAYAWLKFKAPHNAEAKPGEAPAADAAPAEKGEKVEKGEKPAGQAAGVAKMGPIMDLDPFIVNLSDADPRFLKVTVKLELDGPGAKTELGDRLPQVRDAILVLLSSKDAQGLKPTAGKMQLRDEILQRVNSLLSAGQARNAYFTEFVVQ